MEQVRKYLKELGFVEQEIDVILSTYSVFNMQEKTLLKHCIENNTFFINNNYLQEDVIKTTKSQPTLYGLNIDNIKQKIIDIIELGYTKEEVIKMTRLLPALYSLSIDNIKQKIEYLKEINLEYIVFEDTK